MALVGNISGSSQSNSVIGISGSVIVENRPNGSFPAFPGADVTFFVSGSQTERSSFGGDLVVSGTLYSNNDLIIAGNSLELTGALLVSGSGHFTGNVLVDGAVTASLGLSGSLTKLADGTSYLIAGSNITISSASNGAVTITGTTASAPEYFFSAQAGSIYTTGSAAFAGAEGITAPSDKGADVSFYVSGSKSGDASALFGGNVVTSGSLQVDGNATVSGDLNVMGTTTTIDTVNLEVRDAVVGLGFSSGTIALTAGDRGWIGGLDAADNAVFKWDNSATEFAVGRTQLSSTGSLPITLTSYSNLHTANIQASIVTASLGFSGSLTRLVDGTSYLIASGGASITSASNGAVTVFAPEATVVTSPGDNRLLTSDGTTTGINGETNFTFDGSLLALTGSMEPGADITYNLGSADKRWANVYTGDLHLRNDRGDWTVIEEEENLTIRNNKTGKMFRFVLESIDTK